MTARIDGGREAGPDAPPAGWARATVSAFLALLAAGGAALVGASFLADPGAGGSIPGADPTPGHLRAAADRARWIGALVLVSALPLLPLRRRIARVLAREARATGSRLARVRREAAASIRRDGRLHVWALGAVVVAGVVLRVLHLSQPIRYDEAATYLSFATRPLYLLISDYSYPNNHILHTLLVRISTGIFGDSPAAIRIPALTSGLLVLPATYLFAREFYDKWTGLLATAFVAVSAPQILYSTNARGYTLVGLCFLALLVVARRAASGGARGWWAPFVAVTVVGFYAVPVMLYPFLLVLAWMWCEAAARDGGGVRGGLATRAAAATGIAAAATLLLYVPPLVVSGPRHVFAPPVLGAPLPPGEFLAAMPSHLASVWAQWTDGLPRAIEALLAVGLAVSLVRHRKLAGHAVPVPLAVLVLLPVLTLQRVYPPERVWLFLVPLFLTAAAAGLVHVAALVGGRHARAFEVAVAAVAVTAPAVLGAGIVRSGTVVRSLETGTFREAERVVDVLDDELSDGDRILAMLPSTAPLRYHLEDAGLSERWLDEVREPATRYFVVVDRREGQSLREVIDRRGLPPSAADRARVVERLDATVVYVLAARQWGS